MLEIEIRKHISVERVPGDSPEEKEKWKIQHKWNYAHPFQRRSLKDLQKIHPEGKTDNGNFIIDDGQKRRIFDNRGFEVRRETYRRIREDGKPHSFDTIYWENSTYDDEGYLINVAGMKFGLIKFPEPGFTRTIKYEIIDGLKVPKIVITQPVDRQGVMEIGMPLGNAESVDLTEVPLIAPKSTLLYPGIS